MPTGVPAGTDTIPVVGSSTGTLAPAVAGVADVRTVALMAANVTGAPFSVSLVKALTTEALPVAPLVAACVSSVATIAAAETGTVTVAVEQLVGFSFSQIS